MASGTVEPLVDAIFSIIRASDAAAICAREPFAPGTDAVITSLTQDFRVPDEVQSAGFKYFLGKQDVLKLIQQVSMKRASRETQAEYVAHYATFDAYPSWFNDLPDR